MEYQGSCHCGAIRFQFVAAPIQRGLRCNCSLCLRKGALMSPEIIPASEFYVTVEEEGMLGLYQFGSHRAKHYFCRRCGIYPFHETLRKADHYRVNLGCVDDLDVLALPVEVLDGRHLLPGVEGFSPDP